MKLGLRLLTGLRSLPATCSGQTTDVPRPPGGTQGRGKIGSGRARAAGGLPTRVEFQLQ